MKLMIAPLLILPTAFGQTALTIAQIAKKVSPSVVGIEGKTDSREVLGSGFIISKDGKIVTNPVSYTHLDVYKRQITTWSPIVSASELPKSKMGRSNPAIFTTATSRRSSVARTETES